MAFTDLVNSTAIKSLLPGHDREARNQVYIETVERPHRSRLTDRLNEFEGRVVKSLGDGFFLVFANLPSAARWAISVQKSLEQQPITTPLGPLEVKIGLHVGSPEVSPHDPNDYLGQEVDFAARLRDLSAGRQIVISESAAALLRDAQLDGLCVHSHGLRDLKGIGCVQVFELLRQGQAPRKLKQPAASPTNLPAPPAAFIGREDLIETIESALRDGGVTILKGEGGMGKTALSLKVAHGGLASGAFSGGVAWVNCELGPGREECLRQVAQVFFGDRMEQESLEQCQDRVLEHVKSADSLIVLDNFETIAHDAEMLCWLAELRPPARVLVTTREQPPGLHGRVIPVHELTGLEAVALFTEKATQAGFDAAGREPEIEEICTAVGGQPLAIELLAARCGLVPLTRLLQRVRSGPDVIAAPADPTRNPRHQSLLNCIELSLRELSQPASDMLLRLCVFPDGASPAVICAVLGTEEWDEAAAQLVAASVWRLSGNRYTVHPLVRQIALGKLGTGRPAREAEAARAVATFVSRRAQEVGSTPVQPAALAALKAALNWCEAELRNLVASADLAFAAGDWMSVFQLSASLFNFFQVRGYWNDAEHLHNLALSATRSAGHHAGEALTLNHLGLIYLKQGRWKESEAAHQESLRIWRSVGDPRGTGNTLKHLGRLLQLRERLDESEAVCIQALDVLRKAGDPVGEAKTLGYLGNVYRYQERFPEAVKVYEEGLQVSRRVGDRYDEGDILRHLGQVYHCQGQIDQAKQSLQKSLAIWRAFDDRHSEAVILDYLGAVLRDEGRHAEAEEMFLQSFAVFEEFRDRRKEAASLLNQAKLHALQGKTPTALELAHQAVTVLEQTEDSWSLRKAREFAERLTAQSAVPAQLPQA